MKHKTQIAKDYSKMIKERESKPKVYEAHGEGGSHTLSTIPFHGGKEKGND